ncbi:MAG: lipid-binding SYLF domain-containing protein [Rhodospirillales bacterium]
MRRRELLAAGAATVAAGLTASWPARAGREQQEIVDKARITAESMLADANFPSLRQWVARARGVLVVPSLVKAGFLIGAEGGSGVLLARKDGAWVGPAFYTLGAASFGLQAGVQDSEVMFVVMTDKGLRAMMSDEFKLGADASIAIGPVGAGVEGATTSAFNADIYSFARAKGLFGGFSFEGAVVKSRDSYNTAYYGAGATARGIVLEGRPTNAAADALRQALVVRQ